MGQSGARRVTLSADRAPLRLMPLLGTWKAQVGRFAAAERPRSLDFARELAPLGMTGVHISFFMALYWR
jgi:hypothetical protein